MILKILFVLKTFKCLETIFVTPRHVNVVVVIAVVVVVVAVAVVVVVVAVDIIPLSKQKQKVFCCRSKTIDYCLSI